MPLHDWAELDVWGGVHDIWLVELLRCIKPQLPPGFRAHLASSTALTVGTGNLKPDVSIRRWQTDEIPATSTAQTEPDEEVATITLEPERSLFVSYDGHLAACLELISPRNKDRPAARDAYLARCLGYLQAGVNLLLVDVHPQPLGFSFDAALSAELRLARPPLTGPLAVAYRVGEPAPDGGRFLAAWRRQLIAGQPLPTIPLPLTVFQQVQVDLENTYMKAATDAYLT